MMGTWKVALVAAMAIGVIVGAALFVSKYNSDATELVQQAPKSGPKMHLVKREMLASAAQNRLAQKDRRIFKSIALAASSQEKDGMSEEKKFLEARKQQIQLDSRLESLTQKLRAQELALEYMKPKVAQRDTELNQLTTYVGQLKHEIPLIDKDLAAIHKRASAAGEAMKPLREQLLRTEEVLAKSRNAYSLFGEREQQSRQEAAAAREQVENYNFEALRAEQLATALRKEATSEADKARAKYLAQEAKTDAAKVAMLNKESAEMLQSAQLFDAEADEAAAYQTMFSADVQTSAVDEKRQTGELDGATRVYEQGEYLEASGREKELALAKDLQAAEQALASATVTDKRDDAALLRGEKATQATQAEAKALWTDAVENTQGAEKDMAKLSEDHSTFENDAEQARSLEIAAAEHLRASQHLARAAAAAEEVKKIQ